MEPGEVSKAKECSQSSVCVHIKIMSLTDFTAIPSQYVWSSWGLSAATCPVMSWLLSWLLNCSIYLSISGLVFKKEHRFLAKIINAILLSSFSNHVTITHIPHVTVRHSINVQIQSTIVFGCVSQMTRMPPSNFATFMPFVSDASAYQTWQTSYSLYIVHCPCGGEADDWAICGERWQYVQMHLVWSVRQRGQRTQILGVHQNCEHTNTFWAQSSIASMALALTLIADVRALRFR